MNQHTLVFDLVYLDRPKSAGVAEDVARAHADGLEQALRESVATKADLERLETRLGAKIDTAAARLETRIAEAQIAAARWTFGAAVAFAGMVWAIVRYSH